MKKRRTFEELRADIAQLLVPSFAEDSPNFPLERAEGIYLYGPDGRRVMDFTAGFAVANVGHCHPKVLEAARMQMEKIIHSAVGLTLHESVLQLCDALIEVLPSGMNMFFFGNSGAEAIEGTLKAARYISGRPAIIAFEGGFHGRTFGAASVTSIKSKYRDHYEPFLPGIYFAPFPDPYRCPLGEGPEAALRWTMMRIQELFERLVPPSQVAAFLVEPIQGEGGYIVPPPDFLKELRGLCDRHQILLILDEIQTGFGRTGEMFASQVFGVRPDLMAIAKGIASGFPLSAVVGNRDLLKKWKFGSHGTTFGGNPVACAAGLATLEVIREEGLLANCRKMGARLLQGFEALKAEYPIVGHVRGKGLMVAMEFIVPGEGKKANPEAAGRVLDECYRRGLIAYTAGAHGQVVRMMPPLILTEAQADEALSILNESLAAASKAT